jgi:bifunctional non-homologous end joining protein LigD
MHSATIISGDEIVLFQPIKPMLADKRAETFDDDRYIFEPKWDGWRMLLHKQGERIEAYTRHGNIVTSKFPELREAAVGIRAHEAILDCEGTAYVTDGVSLMTSPIVAGCGTNGI